MASSISVTGIGMPSLADILKNSGGLGGDLQKQQEDEQEEMRKRGWGNNRATKIPRPQTVRSHD